MENNNKQNTESAIIATTTCVNHPSLPFTFFCFDDKTFFCNSCFNLHRHHNIETKEDLSASSKFFNLSHNQVITTLERLLNFQKDMKAFLLQIEQEKAYAKSQLEKYNKKEQNNAPYPQVPFLDMTYEEYQRMSIIPDILNSIERLNLNVKRMITEHSINTYWVSQTVDIIEHSKCVDLYGAEIMLGKSKGMYTLFDGNKNHFCIFDFKKQVYLSQIEIIVYNFQCTLKNFTVKVKNNVTGQYETVGKYQRSCYDVNNDAEYIKINREGRFFRFDFIDNWGAMGGNYILIKGIRFEIADI